MKTKELINVLQKIDDSGELEVTLDGLIIDKVFLDEFNCLALFDKDKKTISYEHNKKVINIKHKTVLDLFILFDNLQIDYSKLPEELAEMLYNLHKGRREWTQSIDQRIKLYNFTNWVLEKYYQLSPENYNFLRTNIIFEFFKTNNLDKQELPNKYLTQKNGQNLFWEECIDVKLDNGFLKLEMKNNNVEYSI